MSLSPTPVPGRTFRTLFKTLFLMPNYSRTHISYLSVRKFSHQIFYTQVSQCPFISYASFRIVFFVSHMFVLKGITTPKLCYPTCRITAYLLMKVISHRRNRLFLQKSIFLNRMESGYHFVQFLLAPITTAQAADVRSGESR